MTNKEKLLIVGPAWVGDMVMAQSLFMLLRQNNPAAIIDVVAPSWSEPLLARMPEVRRTVAMPVGHGEFGLRLRFQVGKALRTEQYDRAIVLPRSLKSSLVPFVARIPKRTGFRGEMRYGLLNDVRELDRERLDQTIKRFVALGQPADSPLPEPPKPALQIDSGNLAQVRAQLQVEEPGKVVALMPGAAFGPAKCWPIEHFATLAAQLVTAGSAVWVLGAQDEKNVGDAICASAGPGAHNLCGRTRLVDTVDLLSAADAAVTNDSGLMHVAAAAGTHVVAIYGSSSPKFTPPQTPHATVEYLDLDCSPCFERNCPLGHLRCLTEISPHSIAEKVRRLL